MSRAAAWAIAGLAWGMVGLEWGMVGLLVGPLGEIPTNQGGGSAECRCPERPLQAYYSDADEVLVARLVGWSEVARDRRMRMEVTGLPWKISMGRTDPVPEGTSVEYLTAMSTGACGVQPSEGAQYIVFAYPSPADADALRVDTCSGTRLYRQDPGADLEGFLDVPGSSVFSQLDALSGLEFLRAAAAHAPDATDPANETLVGLLDLKALAHGGAVPVRGVPDSAGGLVTTLRSYHEVESREVGYEAPAAVVVARANGWFRVRIPGAGDDPSRYGWVGPGDAGAWFPYSELPVRRLTYATNAWSGHLWPAPGSGIPLRSRRAPLGRSSAGSRYEHPVDVQETVVVDGMPWFRIEVLSESPCVSGATRSELSGWVPAYGAEGRPVVWYYSRGC